MDINLFDFELPEELIAQSPSEIRDHSRLLVVNKRDKTYVDQHFYNIIDYLQPGDVLVRNNTKVIPARLLGTKKETGAHIELLLLHQIEGSQDEWECMSKPAKSIKIGTEIYFGENDELKAICLGIKDEGIRIIKFVYDGIFLEILDKLGKMPLPPYIKKQVGDKNRYQTVYAKVEGSAAAPTAGFHFTPELLKRIEEKGIEIIDITLHIGLGTFRQVKVDKVEDHHMHEEEYEISEIAAKKINLALSEHRRIIAVGTTAIRTLEANFNKYHKIVASKEKTDIFIKPGYEFKVVNAIITNFHLPKSTLIMLVSAFMNRDFTLEVYRHAVEEKYRFFSFGDAMFIYE